MVAKTKYYGFTVEFKKRTPKKERLRVIKLLLAQKSVENIKGAITIDA